VNAINASSRVAAIQIACISALARPCCDFGSALVLMAVEIRVNLAERFFLA
jgi:hypothetical protein